MFERVSLSRFRLVFLGAVSSVVVAAGAGCQAPPSSDTSKLARGPLTATADDLRTGWYSDEPGLDPVIVGGPSFGRVWNTTLTLSPGEQVFAQPLVKGDTVFVATEANNLYALDAATGAIKASRALGKPFAASDVGCGDLVPTLGVTGTPVIDDATNTAYFFSKTYLANLPMSDPSNVGWFMHAVDVDTLVERSGFPVPIVGRASNDPALPFNPFMQHQRTALLLMNGVVYAGFGSHCDVGVWHGWIIGVGTDGQVKTLFSTTIGSVTGGGIWGGGGGLVSDGPGRIFFATGNSGGVPDDTPQARPTWQLTQAAVHLQVQADGSLLPVDFFVPSNRAMLDLMDSDVGSGGPIGLPPTFGTAATPRLLLAGGKSGTVYVLDRDRLGGFKQGPGGGDAVVSSFVSAGGLWSREAVWPGDGGYVYVTPNQAGLEAYKYGVSSSGVPTFSRAGVAPTTFGYTSGSPVVTSNGTTSGTAVVWATRSTGAFGTGTLQAYAAVPDGAGKLTLLYEDTYGPHPKFAVPGIGGGRVFVGSRDGHVIAYGNPVAAALTVPPQTFGTVVVGGVANANVVLTAKQAVTVTSLGSSSTAFAVGTPSSPLPAALGVGGTLTVPVSFSPAAAALYAASLDVTTSAGVVSGSLRGQGQSAGAELRASPSIVAFPGIARGTSTTMSVSLSNVGAQPLTWSGFDLPATPFSASGLPAVGTTLAAGASLQITFTFAPTTNGTFSSSFGVHGSGGDATIMMSGAAGDPPAMVITPASLDFFAVAGQVQSLGFTITNTGGSPLTITKSKPPTQGIFTAQTSLDEGTAIPAGQSRFEVVSFKASSPGSYADQWIVTGSDGSGVRTLAFTGTAVAPGDGLTGTYHDQLNLAGSAFSRVDPTVDFDWGSASPDPRLPTDNFSVSWTGQLLAPSTDDYTFRTTSDDGVRLWIDGALVIDDWTAHGATLDTATVPLVLGRRYAIRMDFYDSGGLAIARLHWNNTKFGDVVVPQTYLYSQGSGGGDGGVDGNADSGVDGNADSGGGGNADSGGGGNADSGEGGGPSDGPSDAAPTDAAPPAAPTSLSAAVLDRRNTSVRLSFTAPATSWGASVNRYEVRYAKVPIDASNFDDASVSKAASPTGTPAAPGTADGVTVTGLFIENAYYFAIAAVDAQAKRGPIVSTTAAVTAHFNATTFTGTSGLPNEEVGYAVDGTGDANKDGFSDVLAGTYSSGRAYLYFGGAAFAAAAPSVTITGVQSGFGRGVAYVGDVDGDSFEDVAVADTTRSRIFIYRGRASWPAALTEADASFTITTDASYDGSAFGASIARLGDFDFDGVDDFAVGAPSFGPSVGRVVIVRGSPTFSSFALPSASRAIVIAGDAGLTRPLFGTRVVGLGHFFSGGGTTLVASAPGTNATTSSNEGHLYAFRGQSGTGGSIAIGAADAVVSGAAPTMRLGAALTNLGPISGPLNAVGAGNENDVVSTPGSSGTALVYSGNAAAGPFVSARTLVSSAACTAGTALIGGGVSGRDVSLSLVGSQTPDLVMLSRLPTPLGIVDGATLASLASPFDTVGAGVRVPVPAGWDLTSAAASIIPDVDGDGHPDFVITNATSAVPGKVVVYW
jgi:hypothetical protein